MQINDNHTITITDFPIDKVNSLSLTDYYFTITAIDNNNDNNVKFNINKNTELFKALLYKWVWEDMAGNYGYSYLYSDDTKQSIMRRMKDLLNSMELEDSPF